MDTVLHDAPPPQLHPTRIPQRQTSLVPWSQLCTVYTHLAQQGRTNVISAQMRTIVSTTLLLHMHEASIFCPYQCILPPSSGRLPSWWSVARPASTNGKGGTSVLLFLGLVRAHGGLSPLSRIEGRLGWDRINQ